ncbi:MAG: glycosyltransferase [Mucinivorans sp.]
MSTPKVSIIVPSYNHAPYLKERLDSILGQTFRDFELIILDDSSTDNSQQIIEQYSSEPRVSHVVYNKINSGNTFVQWQKGVDLAQGEWIWIAESDDVAQPTFLSKCLQRDNDKVGLVFCDSQFIDSHGQLLDAGRFNRKLPQEMRGSDFVVNHMLRRNRLYNASMAIFRRSLFEKVPLDYVSKRHLGDWYFWIAIAQNSQQVSYVKEPLNGFRQHQNKVSVDGLKSGECIIEEDGLTNYLARYYYYVPKPYWQWSRLLTLHRLKRNKFLTPEQKENILLALDGSPQNYGSQVAYYFWEYLKLLTPLKLKI